jgi:glycosyltransferase involved in cell wall biosynthesis
MKIIHIHPLSSMAYNFIYPLMEEEKLLGHDTRLIVFKNDSKKIPIINFDLRVNNFSLLIEIVKLIFFLKKHKPNVIFCHNTTSSTVPLFCLKILKCKKIIYFNHGVPYLGYNGILRVLLYSIEYLNIILSDITITVSKSMKKKLDLIKPNTYLIHNGSACGLDLNKKTIQAKVNKKKEIVVSYIGRLKNRKGIKVLKQILEFFDTNQYVKFIFCGFTNEEFEKVTKRKYKNLQCLGFIDSVDKVLENSHIFILPSLHEGLSYSILEAMLHKNLILANNIPGINDLIINSYNGFLIKNNDPKKYIHLINDFLDNKINTKKLIKNSAKTVKKFDRIDFIKSYRDFLTNIT